MAPVIDPIELRLLRIAYRRAHGSAEMPDAGFLSALAHELKNPFPSNADQRDESELFFEYHSRASRDYAELDSRIRTTNDEDPCAEPEARPGVRSPLAKRLPPGRPHPARAGQDRTRLVPCWTEERRPHGRLLRRPAWRLLLLG